MLDYVLVNRNFRTTVLDIRVYRSTYLESDHELVVSTLRYKIRAKRRQPKHGPRCQTRNLISDSVRAYESTLYSSLHHIQQGEEQPDDEVEHIWSMFKSAIREVSQSLPVLPNKQPVEWMMEELL